MNKLKKIVNLDNFSKLWRGKVAFLIVLAALVIVPMVSASEEAHDTKEKVAVEETTTHTEESSSSAEATADKEEHGEEEGHGGGHGDFATTFLWIAVILIIAKIASLVERFGQPSVLGELVIGVVLGNLVLLGINVFEPIKEDSIITFLGELGVVILLFQIGLESNISKMKQVGTKALMVAVIGVVLPFVLGYFIAPLLLPGLTNNAYLFLAAAMTATSVGITARVFQDLGKLKIPEAQIVLGAAVIDDVMGLIILAVVSAMATMGAVSIGLITWIAAKAILFLVGAIVLGQLLAPRINKLFSKIHTGIGMKFTLAISFGLIFAYLAQKLGLAPIVGAFAAGLILDPVHFKYFKNPQVIDDVKKCVTNCAIEKGSEVKKEIDKVAKHYEHKHIEDIIEPVGFLLIPIFFVITGMSVNIETLFNLPILLVALVITVIAFVGKLASGLAAGKTNKWLVGFGMVPRGEVGLIFASIGKAVGVVSDEVFSVIVIMVIFTTLFTPPILTYLLKKYKAPEEA